MATYYVRTVGADANAGTSAGASWRTLAKALGASGIASGDTVYIGAGVYREVVTVNMTSATVETFVIGDVDGKFTGDAGEVRWSAYLTNDTTAPSGTALLNLSGRDFLTFKNIAFTGGSASVISSTTNTSTNITFTKCLFVLPGASNVNVISVTSAANVALVWVIDSCILSGGQQPAILITPERPATADFDIDVQIKNCQFYGAGSAVVIRFVNSGANAFNPGGMDVYNCTLLFGVGAMLSVATNSSTTIPCTIYNCIIFMSGNALTADTSGQIIEDYNLIWANVPRQNVTAGSHSVSDSSYAPLFFTGHEYSGVGSNLMPFGMPKPGSPLLGFGNQASSPTVDLLNAARPSGLQILSFGTATAGGAKTLTDSGKTWGTNSFAGATVKIISGTGSGQTKTIASNTATVLTVDGNWKTNPSTDSVYEIYAQAMSSSGTATSGTTTSLTDSNAAWGTNMWQGYTLSIDGGTGSPQTLLVTTNTATVLSFATATAPDATSTYKLFRGASENVINAGVGCYEYGQSAVKETTTVRTGSNALRIPGAGYIDFAVPVNATSTTITIYARYDSAYSGTLPSINIVNGTECGVANATATCVGAANTWEQLSLTFTPTAIGIITVRFISSTTTPTGNAFFDDWAII